MAKRPNWYYDHPPACTCARCVGGGGRSRRPTRISLAESDGDALPPAPDPPADGSASKGGMGCVSWIALGVAVILIGSIVANALGTFEFGAASPTPRPAVVQTFPIPTPTVTPIPQASVQEPESTPTPEPTSTPTPSHTSTPDPTAISTPNPTPTPIAYIIQKLGMESVRVSQELVVVDFSVDLKNIRGLEGAGSVPFQMAIDGGEPELVHIITGFDPGEEASFVFARELTPGSHTVTFFIGDVVIDEMSIDVEPAGVSLLPTPTPTSTPTPTPEPTETPAPTATPTPGPTHAPIPPNTPTPEPTETPTPTATPTPEPTATQPPASTPSSVPPSSAATPEPAVSPALRHIEEKRYMLELINTVRTQAGLDPVVLGDNVAAQLHAESSLDNCVGSHWGIDGLKPYMILS